MKTEILKKLPWKTILRVVGYSAVGGAAVISAAKADENTQVAIKKVAEKIVSKGQKS